MNSFEETFENLENIDKKCINAYRSAREFKNMATQIIVCVNGKPAPVIIASIVNKAFACEVFLKSIIIMNTKKITNEHSLIKLVKKSNSCLEIRKKLNNYDFNEELEKINNAFVEWRYTYERDKMIINNGFLNDFCNTLEEISRIKILEEYKLNMLESFI